MPHLYVPGELADSENVIVDVGTGYFVQKAWHFSNSIPDAKAYYKEKVTYLKGNIEKLQETITQREQQYRVLSEVMQSKLEQQQQQQTTKA
ncbi:subunit of tubulin prefoldin [Phlyctochytrium planicorne]|nr:subunit of tubulin prefoldin [Phlyctochytrium planicorne]